MNAERWRQIKQIHASVLEREPERREAFLDEACAGDETLRKEVASLLAQEERSQGLFDSPAFDAAAKALAKDQAQERPPDLTGQTLSHYRILEKIGEGGMGVVYRAEDTHLNRQVAIKVLPGTFLKDQERLARFEREAKLLAVLNHPNIAAIYGLERTESTPLLIMELVQGKTLAERLAKGPLPVAEALKVSRQIAEGLEAAHERGIVHRDLKPANVKITSEGQAKILDFGLAKALRGEPDLAEHPPDISDVQTDTGVILGTAAYMSPEQANGRAVDKRADIWAFGCILFECLTGKRAFQGRTTSEIVAAILKEEPDWGLLPATAVQPVKELVRRCLQKDPRKRLRDMGDARIEIDEALSGSEAERVVSTRKSTRAWILVGLTGLILGAAATLILWPPRPAPSLAVERFSISLPAGLTFSDPPGLAILRDGRTLVFAARAAGEQRLYLRRLDEMELRPLKGTENGRDPFLSPDGEWVGYSSVDRGLCKIPLAGGPSLPISAFIRTLGQCGADWHGKNRIVFSGGFAMSGLWSVSSEGGTPQPVVRPNQEDAKDLYTFPDVLPDNRGVVFTVFRNGKASVSVLSFGTGKVRTVISPGRNARYLPTRHLAYESEGQLRVVSFDPQQMVTAGVTRALIEDVGGPWPSIDYDVSSNGTLAYVPASACMSRLVWKDRSGDTKALEFRPRHYMLPTLSPDGLRVVAWIREGSLRGVYSGTVEGEPFTRLTPGDDDLFPLFTRDGKYVLFTSGRAGKYNMYRISAEGSGEPERLTDSPLAQKPTSLSPDGNTLLFNQGVASGDNYEIWECKLNRPNETRPFVRGGHLDFEATFSPDGRWVAYQSDQSGRFEIYVRPYPGPEPKKQLSTNGGWAPVWNPNGRELFYKATTGLMAVPMAAGHATGPPYVVFAPVGRASQVRDYSVSPDGQRFLFAESVTAPQINVVTNWFEELKRLVPTK